MKRTEILPAVEKAIAERRPFASGHYYITLQDNKILCVGGDKLSRPELTLVTLTAQGVEEGFTPRMWNIIEGKVAVVLRQKGLLCEELKP